jgi:pteridine reductase
MAVFAGRFLHGRTALVTGGSVRIGRAITDALAAHGANVLIHYNTSRDEAEAAANAVIALGVDAWVLPCDFCIAEDAEKYLDRAIELAGPIDILINNASSFPASELDTFTADELMDSVQVNAYAPLQLARRFAHQEIPGHIINFLDTRIVDFDKKHAAYHLSKRMLFTLTRGMAEAYAPEIQVNAVAPGLVLPPEGKDEQYLADLAHTNPLQKYGHPDDITAAVLFLLHSSFITGQIIYVDGGRHMKGAFYGL